MNVPPNDRPAFRRDPRGHFEFRYRQSLTARRGYVEEWEPASTHVVKNVRIPAAMLDGLRGIGYQGGAMIHDLLVADGWTPPDVGGYLEVGGS